jgi:orotidine-5'-phosphate decarboxylase
MRRAFTVLPSRLSVDHFSVRGYVDLAGKDRLIVALDVPAIHEAISLVAKLDNVSFFKIGWQLFTEIFTAAWTSGKSELLTCLQEGGRKVFIDLKLPADIGNTIGSMVARFVGTNVKLLTLNEHMPSEIIRTARAARGESEEPKLLMVPYLSSLDARHDLEQIHGRADFETFLLERAAAAITAGCDGLIASGSEAISTFRQAYPKNTGVILVSPGIRPSGSSHHDHKRFTTPAEAITFGADYLVVGRPVLNDSSPRDAAQRIIDEIDGALESLARSARSGPESGYSALVSTPQD